MTIKILNTRDEYASVPFTVESVEFSLDGQTVPERFHRIRCPDWINVVPITLQGDIVMIEQPRVGTGVVEWETPGGCLEEGEDPLEAAKRELEEETGYCSEKWVNMGTVCPNPAIQGNTLHLFLALDCIPVTEKKHHQDLYERITTHIKPISDLQSLIDTGNSSTPSQF